MGSFSDTGGDIETFEPHFSHEGFASGGFKRIGRTGW
jgi:hypothetical protein